MLEQIISFFQTTGYANLSFEQFIMILIACFLMYLAIVKEYEPLLLVPISFGMLLANIPVANLMEEGNFYIGYIKSQIKYIPTTYIFRCWSHDRLWTVNCKSKEFYRCSTQLVFY